MTNSADVRKRLIDALRLDLVGPADDCGPEAEASASEEEILPQEPSRWYLTGFLVPIDADASQRADVEADDELDEAGDARGLDDAAAPEPAAARVRYLPSSLGLSVLVPAATTALRVTVRWGDYAPIPVDSHVSAVHWQRQPRQEAVELQLPDHTEAPFEIDVPNSRGLRLVISVRPVGIAPTDGGLPAGVRCASLFLVNRRVPAPDVSRDTALAFQAELEVTGDEPFVPRPNLRKSDDWDERVADLQFRDAYEFAVGHNVATTAELDADGQCRRVRTCWIPQADVERVAASEVPGVELSMDALAELAAGADAKAKLGAFAVEYRKWIAAQIARAPTSPLDRKETATELLNRAEIAANRLEQGVASLADPPVLEAFRIANRAMAMAARQRMKIERPCWRPFQLAFLLMNLPGMVDPTHDDREVVDLLFFPTGGGKTEAYLGLAAFTIVFRRLQNPGIGSAGLSVLMRYTLRLLTLDQLGRAATLICALELIRQQDAEKLGEWPFEIGLWVGRAATPNRMGSIGDKDRETARAKTIAYKNDDRKPIPIPLEECPWCGERFKPASFQLVPNDKHPTDLRIVCVNRRCDFSRDQHLPILAVDEPIYRRLPCFLIATVDKFAALPWTGEVGQFFGRVDRHDSAGFYGPCMPHQGHTLPDGRLPPPDLIIQDELHLISGPLGTMAGLYETALDQLSIRQRGGQQVRPKIVASTATVRRAEKQIRALFNHPQVEVFPPPGPDRRDSFFARVVPVSESPARRYVGIAAQGRSPKVAMLRVYLALLSAAQKIYDRFGPKDGNPADPYMTLLGYFNSLRELGGARRVVEDEVSTRLLGYASRLRVGDGAGGFANRKIAYEVVELTSRVNTDRVAEAKRRLAASFADKEHVDVALATNMISVGLDIVRLGLMVVFGQPKTSAEYIQSTSRVGRDSGRPGLVVTILNVHKARDRSHYERFAHYHETFYRSVEATSVTPFSPRALDRGLGGTLVALARQGLAAMTPALGAGRIEAERQNLDFVVDALAERARMHANLSSQEAAELRLSVRNRALDLLDEWSKISHENQQQGVRLQYQAWEVGAAIPLLHEFLNPELKSLPPSFRKFRANRSLRDVEPSVNLWVRTLDGSELPEVEG